MSSLRYIPLCLLAVAGCKTRGFNNEGTTESLRPQPTAKSTAQPSLFGKYQKSDGVTINIAAGTLAILQPNGNRIQGHLERDGSLGASYTVRFQEGFVCGSYNLSLWIAEGQMGDGSQFKLSWNKPTGSVVRECGHMSAAEGQYSRSSTVVLRGVYSDGKSNVVHIEGGKVTLSSGNAKPMEGQLERDGSLGASYTIRFPEGFVCGTYNLSLWAAEGVVGNGSQFKLKWNKPEGSVVRSCGDMQLAEGSYNRTSNFGGDYYNADGTKIIIDTKAGLATLVIQNEGQFQGQLERDGTMGGSYKLRFKEGFVCGSYSISLWISEGTVGDGSWFKGSWQEPTGSVRNQCGFMRKAQGVFIQ